MPSVYPHDSAIVELRLFLLVVTVALWLWSCRKYACYSWCPPSFQNMLPSIDRYKLNGSLQSLLVSGQVGFQLVADDCLIRPSPLQYAGGHC